MCNVILNSQHNCFVQLVYYYPGIVRVIHKYLVLQDPLSSQMDQGSATVFFTVGPTAGVCVRVCVRVHVCVVVYVHLCVS